MLTYSWLGRPPTIFGLPKVGLREGFYAQVCFHCQQICEKALKSMLYGSGARIVYGHALVELCSTIDLPSRVKDELPVLDQ